MIALRRFGPRALVVAALIFHMVLAFLFWLGAVHVLLAIARLYPVAGTLGIVSAMLFACWFTRLAWCRNTWSASALYLLICVMSLPWTVLAIVGWIHPD